MPEAPPPTIRLALLRGINVGGHRRLPMAVLRELASELGYTGVSTYIASGNLLFRAASGDEELAAALAGAIRARFGFAVDVLVVDGATVARALAEHPFADGDPRMVHVGFCDAPVSSEALDRMRALTGPGERVAADGRLLYLDHGPAGVAGSALTARLTSLLKPGFGTARNLNTLTRLAALLRG
jgi:uncharacterized protein (DUF1697 family)